MSLTAQEQEDLKEILVVIFSDYSFRSRNVTEETLSLTETLLEEIQQCNKRIHALFNSLHCGMIGKGWLRRCIGGIKDIVMTEPSAFHPCMVVDLSRYRNAILISTFN